MGHRQASLGTPVPRTPIVAPGLGFEAKPKGKSEEYRGLQQPAATVGAWRLIGRGRLHFPTLPRQLPILMSP